MASREPSRRLKASERRAVILDAALDVFAETGYEGTAMDEVARRAGITKPVLYDHFASKEALYSALLERESTAMVEATVAELDPAVQLEERLRAVAGAAVAYAREHSAAARLLAQIPVGEPSALEAHRRIRTDRRRATAEGNPRRPRLPASGRPLARTSAELVGDLHNAALERLVVWALEHPRASIEALADVVRGSADLRYVRPGGRELRRKSMESNAAGDVEMGPIDYWSSSGRSASRPGKRRPTCSTWSTGA